MQKDAGRRILVSRDTMERCAGAFDFVSCGTFHAKGLALMFKTHPTPAERLDALERLQPTLDAYAGQPQLAERFAGAAGR